jgi:Domain of unknown function (DUF1707)
VVAGPGDEMASAAAGRGRMRASHADREQVIDTLKTAFVHGRLTRDELDARTGRALAARTYAELSAVTADIPAVPSAAAAAGLARPPTPARRWPLARAAAKSRGCLVLAFALVLFAANVIGNPYHPWSSLSAFVALCLVLAALGIFATEVATSVVQRRSRRQLPPRPGPGGHAPEAEQSSGTGHGPALPPDRPDQTRADLRSDSSRPGWPCSPGRGARKPRGVRPVPDAV